MDAFSFIFTLFGLLMGLALAEAIGGFGEAVEMRHRIRIGWLVPLLALLITFDITSLWLIAWQSRSAIPISFISLAAGLIIFGIYYLIAQLAFPDDIEHWPDLDAYYFQHRRWLMGGMYLCNLLAMAGEQAIGIAQLSNANQWTVFHRLQPGRGRSLFPARQTAQHGGAALPAAVVSAVRRARGDVRDVVLTARRRSEFPPGGRRRQRPNARIGPQSRRPEADPNCPRKLAKLPPQRARMRERARAERGGGET